MLIEPFLIAALGAALDVPVAADVSSCRARGDPDSFVTVELVDCPSAYHGAVERPQVAVQSWAQTRHAALLLAASVDDAMCALEGAWPVTKVNRSKLYNFPSPDGIPRYQAVYDLVAHADKEAS